MPSHTRRCRVCPWQAPLSRPFRTAQEERSAPGDRLHLQCCRPTAEHEPARLHHERRHGLRLPGSDPRGGLCPDGRIDPIIGQTSFAYDAFNRRAGVTDVNQVTTATEYDSLDRVTWIVQEGATPAEELVTEQVYGAFGDLFRTVLPAGNMIEYGYDGAGRLVSMERKPDTVAPEERTFYVLNDAGNRIREPADGGKVNPRVFRWPLSGL